MKLRIYLPAAVITLMLGALTEAVLAQDSLPAAVALDPFLKHNATQNQVTLAPAPARAVDPVTGLPMVIDPNTGLPMPAQAPVWIDPSWKEPAKVVTNIDFDGLPLSEVVLRLNEIFKGYYDTLPFPDTPPGGLECGTVVITLHLSNVHFSDIINAMNLVFENNKLPIRWHLELHNNHPFLILREEYSSAAGPTDAGPKIRRIFYVGDILGDEKSGGMTMDKLNETISDLWTTTFGGVPTGNIGFHNDSQLLVFTGTAEQVDFIQQTLAALKQRSEWARSQSKSDGTNKPVPDGKPVETK